MNKYAMLILLFVPFALIPIADAATGSGLPSGIYKTITSGGANVTATFSFDTLELIAGSGITISPNFTGDSITFTATGGGGATVNDPNTDCGVDNHIKSISLNNSTGQWTIACDADNSGGAGDIITEGNSNVEVIDAGTGEINFDLDGIKEWFMSTGIFSGIDKDSSSIVNVTINDFSNNVAADEVHVQVRNESGAAMARGDAVYVSGYNLGQDLPLVSLADSSSSATMPAFGIVANGGIANNANGEVYVIGRLADVNTGSWSAGDVLYVSNVGTSGNTLTNVKPTGTDLIEQVGEVLRSHASFGRIEIELTGVEGLPNVAVHQLDMGGFNLTMGTGNILGSMDCTNGQILEYNSGTNTWECGTDDTGAGGGEANTASNVGSGVGVFDQKNGVDLEFNSLIGGAGITITDTTQDITIDSDLKLNTTTCGAGDFVSAVNNSTGVVTCTTPSGSGGGAYTAGFTGINTAVAKGATSYFGLFGGSASSEASVLSYIDHAKTAQNLRCYVSASSTSANSVVTVMKNSVATGVTVTFGSGVTGWQNDLSNTVSVASGDTLSIQVVNNSGGGGAKDLTIQTCTLELA